MYHTRLDNLLVEFVVIWVALSVEGECFRFLPVDTQAVQIVISQSQPHLQTAVCPSFERNLY